jgi:hypothetical protein
LKLKNIDIDNKVFDLLKLVKTKNDLNKYIIELKQLATEHEKNVYIQNELNIE